MDESLVNRCPPSPSSSLTVSGLLERSALAPAAIDSLEVVEGCGVGVRLELSLGLSSGKVECRKRVRESNEIVGVKKPKMEKGPMHYCL
ncbi:hypothetical protein IEQ34_000816 [Dendrobium chrysotoxum]|uniref:Uncharacterized protein n=1 Tax=Dendrobium chrysotoxum TaxID=161865 RepID=A0AAV7HU80_DENCH|nr:hypothetical protein IEQ34_000816 [Dendrobium chrysotoxum]